MPAKKIVQDIVPTRRRSVRSIPIERIHEEPEEVIEIEETKRPKRKVHREIHREMLPKKSKLKGIITFSIILICIGIIGASLTLIYTKAVVTITPRVIPINIDGTFLAKKDSQGDALSYQIITAPGEVSKTILAEDGPLIQRKAKGIVTLYNSYSATAQKLLAGTRLSNKDGLIYRTSTSITIPGRKVVAGKTTPGSISVEVVADQVGEKYNSLITDLNGDFSIVAYKGTDKYTGFYGRIKTDIKGGYMGHDKIISKETSKAIYAELQNSLKEKLISQISLSVPEGYVLFDNAYTIENTSIATTTVDAKNAKITLKGTLYGLIFNNQNLINYIAQKQIQQSQLVSYRIEGLKDLDFRLTNTKDFKAKDGSNLNFSLKGGVSIIGTIVEKDLKSKLVGRDLKETRGIIMESTSVSSSAVFLTPFWMRSFPKSVDNIKIEYK